METLYFPEWSVVIAVRVSRRFSLFVPSIAGSCRVHACIENRPRLLWESVSSRLSIHTLSLLGTTTIQGFLWWAREDDNTRGILVTAIIIFKSKRSNCILWVKIRKIVMKIRNLNSEFEFIHKCERLVEDGQVARTFEIFTCDCVSFK